MSTEATRTQTFLTKLRARAGVLTSDADVTKYNDRSTSGTSDASLTKGGRTVWMEFKHRKVAEASATIHELLKATNRRAALQIYRCWRLWRCSEGRAFFVIFEPTQRVSLVTVLCPRRQTFALYASGTRDEMIAHLVSLCH